MKINELVTEILLDNKPFDAASKKVDKKLDDIGKKAEKTNEKISDSTKESAKSFDNLTYSAGKFFAMIGGVYAIKSFIEQTIEANSSLERLSQNLGVNVSQISAWGKAAERAGGSAQGLESTLAMLTKAQGDLMITGESALIAPLSALGVSLSEGGRARKGADVLLDLAQRFEGMDRVNANYFGNLLGIDQGTINQLVKGRAETEATIRKMEANVAVTKAQAEASERMRQKIVDSKQAFMAFGNNLLEKATPALEKLIDLFNDFGSWVKENEGFVTTFLTTLAVGLAAVGVAAIPINKTALAFVALGAAIAGFIDDYQTWKKGGDSLFDYTYVQKLYDATDGYRGVVLALGSAFLILARNILASSLAAVGLGGSLGALGRLGKAGAVGAAGVAGWEIGTLLKEHGIDALVNKLTDGKSQGLGQWLYDATHDDASPTPKQSGSLSDSQRHLKGLEQKYGLQEGFLDRVWQKESGRGKNMLSPKGAKGHFQFMDETARQYGLKNPNDFYESSEAAARMYSDLLKANNGDYRKAAAAYNWGQGNLNRKGLENAPAETRNYMDFVAGAADYNRASNSVSNRTTNTIGEVKVYTQATDADGIAKDMSASLEYLFTSQANYGAN